MSINCVGKRLSLILAAALVLGTLLAPGCGSKWMHATKGQDQLKVDRAECELRADQAGLAQSMTGKRPVITTYYAAFTNCMVSKGWVPKKGVDAAKKQMALKIDQQPLVRQTGDNQFVFQGKKIRLPAEVYEVKLGQVSTTDTTYQQILTFKKKGPIGDYQGEMIFQIAREPASFEPSPYPVASPFFVYDQGGLNSEETWRAFAGPTKDKWMLGIGSRWHLNKKKRVIITGFVNEDPPVGDPQAPSRITPSQARILDDIIATFLPWMNTIGKKGMLRRLFEFDAEGLTTSFK